MYSPVWDVQVSFEGINVYRFNIFTSAECQYQLTYSSNIEMAGDDYCFINASSSSATLREAINLRVASGTKSEGHGHLS